ncbi:hypothetical protein [Clostridium niameyense]|uniref:hypothetical protein n=1 Tax=Clostridium niameyense TaxID=1622073 RepID=UPI00067E654B|nr:hypothetical protein [Clostridium niameyense]
MKLNNCDKCKQVLKLDCNKKVDNCICKRCPRNIEKCIITRYCSETESTLNL